MISWVSETAAKRTTHFGKIACAAKVSAVFGRLNIFVAHKP